LVVWSPVERHETGTWEKVAVNRVEWDQTKTNPPRAFVSVKAGRHEVVFPSEEERKRSLRTFADWVVRPRLRKVPGVAEVAMQGSLHAANTIRRRLIGDAEAAPFAYRDLGSVAAIGRFRAIFSWHRIRMSGFPAFVVWLFVHLAFLNGFANRFGTLWSWTRSMIGRTRAERVISVAHTGGDLSTPETQRTLIMPGPFPAAEKAAKAAPKAKKK
jgi:hypothetical protein